MKKVFDYTSQETLQIENARLFDRYFHFGAHESELSNHGDFIRIRAGGHDIILYNDDGNIISFENRCPHRGCILISSASGTCEILCPYHGWKFKENQAIIPNKNRFENLQNPGLYHHTIEKCGQFVFFSPSPCITLQEQLGQFWDILETISRDVTCKINDNLQPFLSNWKISLENALENYHVNSVHPNSLGILQPSDGEVIYNGLNSLWISKIQNEKIALRLQKLHLLFNNKYQNENYFSLYLFPFSMISSTYGYSYAFQTFFPKSSSETAFLSRTYATKTEYMEFYESVTTLNHQIFAEDANICNLMQEATLNHYPVHYNSQEERIVVFHKHYEMEIGS